MTYQPLQSETAMDSDRVLLEKAARAAGLAIDKSTHNGGGNGNTGFDVLGNAVLDWHNGVKWNPLTDDGDALRLAVKLNIHITVSEFGRVVCRQGQWTRAVEPFGDDRYAATRLAIVKTAAEIGAAAEVDQVGRTQ